MNRDVRLNWDLIAKLKKAKLNTNTKDSMNIDENNLSNVLRVKAYDFNNIIPEDLDSVIDHPIMVDKYFKKYLIWRR